MEVPASGVHGQYTAAHAISDIKVGGACPPECLDTSHWEISADLQGKEREGKRKNGEKKKENQKREDLWKIENGRRKATK